MAKHLKKFAKKSQYIEYIESKVAILPNVSICADEVKTVYYNRPNRETMYYLSIDGSLVEPYEETSFGPNIVYNSYTVDGGVLEFDGPIVMVGQEAFKGCINLSMIEIPQTVETIKKNAFEGCINLSQVKYEGTKLQFQTINVEEEWWADTQVRYVECVDGKLYLTKYISTYPYGVKNENTISDIEYLIQCEVTNLNNEIEDELFNGCGNLVDVTLPETITKIGVQSFNNCSSLRSIILPRNVNEIGEKSFANNTSLTGFTITSLNKPIIANNAFLNDNNYHIYVLRDVVNDFREGISAFKDYIVPSLNMIKYKTKSEKVIELYDTESFENKIAYNYYGDNFGYITFKDNVTKIGKNAFYNNIDLTEITIPAAVESIGESALSGCSNLESIYYMPLSGCDYSTDMFNSNDCPIYVRRSALSECLSKWSQYNYRIIEKRYNDELWYETTEWDNTPVYPYDIYEFGAKYIDSYLDTNTHKGSIIFETDVLVIGYEAFRDASNLYKIIIPEGVETIGHNAFNYTSLSEVELPKSLRVIDFCAFESAGLTGVTIPTGVTNISYLAFGDNYDLKFLTFLGTTPPNIDDNILDYSDDCLIYVPRECVDIYKSEWPFYADRIYPSNIIIKYTSTDGNIINLSDDSDFGDNVHVKSNTYEDGIGIMMFDMNITKIGNNAFTNCKTLKTIELNDSFISIGKNAFAGCDKLSGIKIPRFIESIGEFAFSGCIEMEYIEYLPCYAVEFKEGMFSSNECPIYVRKMIFSDCRDQWPQYLSRIEIKMFNDEIWVDDINGEMWDDYLPIKESAFEGDLVANHYDWETHEGYAVFNKDIIQIKNSIFDYPWEVAGKIILPDNLTIINGGVFSDCDKVVEIILPKNLKYIGQRPFEYCNRLKNIVLPEHLETIGSYAFAGCSIEEVIIPDSVTTLEDNAFENYTVLKNIILSNSLSVISNYCFKGCTNLQNFSIGSNITDIGEHAFESCGLTGITIPNTITTIKDSTFFNCRSLKEVNFPDNMISLGSNSFNGCNSLEDIDIPHSVTSIGDYAFNGCTSLADVSISDSLISLGNYAFSNCTSLSGFTIPSNVTSIGNYVFNNCTTLGSVVMLSSVTSIGTGMFNGCINLNNIDILNNIIEIKDSAFKNCGLTKLTIPSSVENIGISAFTNCQKLQLITCERTTPPLLGACAFDNTNNCPINVRGYENANLYRATWTDYSERIVSIQPNNEIWYESNDGKVTPRTGAFNANIVDNIDLGSMYILKFDADLTTVGEYAFYYKHALDSITLPNTVTTIGKGAFESCFGLTEFIAPENLETVGDNAFVDCTGIEKIYLFDKINKLGYRSFKTESDTDIVIVSKTPYTIESDTFGIDANIKVPVGYVSSYQEQWGSELNIQEANNIIPYETTDDESVVLGNSLSFGGKIIFNRNGLLVSDGSITTIGESAFKGSTNLKGVTIPSVTNTLHNYVFANCGELESIYIPNNIKSMGGNVFQGCVKMISVRLSEKVASIPDYAFESCSSLSSITIPVSSLTISAHAFENCTGLEEVTMASPSSTTMLQQTSLEDYAFKNCTALKDVPYGSTKRRVKFNGTGIFEGCNSIETLNFPASMSLLTTDFGKETFKNCKGLKTVTGNTACFSHFSEGMFEGCTALENVRTVSKSARRMFYGCSSLKTVSLTSLTNIAEEMFSHAGLTGITIPTTIKTINSRAFDHCENMSTLVFTPTSTLETIGSYAFDYCALTGYTIPASVNRIDDYAFAHSIFGGLYGSIESNVVSGFGYGVFYGTHWMDLHMTATTPPSTGDNIFWNYWAAFRLLVPSASVNAYKTANVWSKYSKYIYADT